MDTGSIAWALASTALVLLMTPGLAFFYGGLVKAKSVVSMMMLSFGALGLIGVLWVLYGFSMSTVDSPWQFSGNPFADFALGNLSTDNDGLIGAAYGATFAIITVALVSGAIADRAKFGSWLLFAGLFATLVYFPVAAWVWGGGWIMSLGDTLGLPAVIDYAGGTAVHVNSGAAALALAIVLGKRAVFRKGAHKPHNVPLVLLGVGILWFGWFGFNAGAEFLNGLANTGLIFINTMVAPAAAILGWLVVEKIKDGKPTAVGAASGAVTGLVAITPSCANLTPGWALLLGLLAGAISAVAIDLKFTWGLPSFRIRHWERPQLADMVSMHPDLIYKHNVEVEGFRSIAEILRAENEHFEKVWYGRKPQDGNFGDREVPKDILDGMFAEMKRLEEKYGHEAMQPGTDFEWGVLSGELSALRWVLGDEWGSLDT